MKKSAYYFIAFVTALMTVSVNMVQAQTLVDQWGSIGGRTGGTGNWTIVTGTPGNAGTVGEDVPTGQWATIRGGFDAPVTATESQAIVVTGSIEFVGFGPQTWSALRYGLFRHDSVGDLLDAGTDSARWSGSESSAYGYMFTPQSGTTYTGNIPGGTNASQGVTMGGSWISTFGGAVGFGGLIRQAPARALFDEGTYDWAISVQPLGDGTNEVRFFMIKQLEAGAEQTSYWYGGTLIDTSGVTDTFNGIAFGLDPNFDSATQPIREMNLTDVQVSLGDPIVVPEPPFEAFFLTNWGSIGGRTGGTGNWKIDTTQTIIGNAGIYGEGVPSGQWATIRGGFDDFPVTATEEKAIIVTGTIEFVGSGPVTWSGLRYGFFRHDSVGALVGAGTDTAHFSGSESFAYGYMFTPQSGTTYTGNIPGGTNASQGVTMGGSWISTFGGAVGFGGLIQQAPARALFDEGTYDWAISVQPLGDGTNEVRFFMIKQLDPGADQTTYWYGGTLIDTSGVTTTFNGVCFGLDPNYDETTSPIRELNLRDVKIDLGDPITVPEPPWQLYFIDQWGFIGGRTGGWKFIPDPVIGNTAIGGTSPNTDWAVVRGGFVGSVRPPLNKALQVTGKLTLEGGGFEGFSGLRFGLFYGENPGEVVEDNEDSTTTRWSGSEDNHSGYLFLPHSGTNDIPVWAAIGGTGTWGAVSNTVWWSTNGPDNYILGSDLQTPENAVAGAGTYDFTITVQRLSNGGNVVKFSLEKDDGGYSFAGETIDNHNFVPTNEFNGVLFGLNRWSGSTTTKMQLRDVNVDLVEPLVAIEDPKEGLLPERYSLRQNYPNPFNPTTTIEFALPQSGDVSLVVYDVAGRAVAELASGHFTAGYHKINFDARNLASGIYFYRLKAKDFVGVKKLVLLK